MKYDIILQLFVICLFIFVLYYAMNQEKEFAINSNSGGMLPPFGIVPTIAPSQTCAELLDNVKDNGEHLYNNITWMRAFVFATVGTIMMLILNRVVKNTTGLYYACTVLLLLFFLMTQSYYYYQAHVLAPSMCRTKNYYEAILKRKCMEPLATLSSMPSPTS